MVTSSDNRSGSYRYDDNSNVNVDMMQQRQQKMTTTAMTEKLRNDDNSQTMDLHHLVRRSIVIQVRSPLLNNHCISGGSTRLLGLWRCGECVQTMTSTINTYTLSFYPTTMRFVFDDDDDDGHSVGLRNQIGSIRNQGSRINMRDSKSKDKDCVCVFVCLYSILNVPCSGS